MEFYFQLHDKKQARVSKNSENGLLKKKNKINKTDNSSEKNQSIDNIEQQIGYPDINFETKH